MDGTQAGIVECVDIIKTERTLEHDQIVDRAIEDPITRRTVWLVTNFPVETKCLVLMRSKIHRCVQDAIGAEV